MERTTQGEVGGLPSAKVSDLREYSLDELAERAGNGEKIISDAASTLTEHKVLVLAQMFNSAI